MSKYKLEIDYGRHEPLGANERYLLPTVAYVSTFYCRKYPIETQLGVTLFFGLLFRWWNGFLEIRIVTGKIEKANEETIKCIFRTCQDARTECLSDDEKVIPIKITYEVPR